MEYAPVCGPFVETRVPVLYHVLFTGEPRQRRPRGGRLAPGVHRRSHPRRVRKRAAGELVSVRVYMCMCVCTWAVVVEVGGRQAPRFGPRWAILDLRPIQRPTHTNPKQTHTPFIPFHSTSLPPFPIHSAGGTACWSSASSSWRGSSACAGPRSCRRRWRRWRGGRCVEGSSRYVYEYVNMWVGV